MNLFVYKKRYLRPIWLIFSLSFILSHGIPGIIPILPLVSEVLQVSSAEITLLLSYFTLSALIFTGIWGYLITRFNQNYLLLSALACYFFGGVLCSLTSNLDILIFLRILQGIGSAGVHVLSIILTTEYYQGQARARVLGASFAFMAIGLFTMPLLSGFLASYSWRLSFIGLHIPTLIPFIIFFFTKKIQQNTQNKKKHSLDDYKRLFSNPKILALFFGSFLIAGLDITIPHLLSLYTAQNFNFSTSQIGSIYAVGNIGIIIGAAFLMKRLSKLRAFPYILLISGFCVSLCLFMFLQVSGLLFFAILLFLYYIVSGTINPFLNYSLSVSVPQNILAPAITMFMICLRLGQSFISYSLSYLANIQGFTVTIYVVIASYMVMIGLIFYFTLKKDKTV